MSTTSPLKAINQLIAHVQVHVVQRNRCFRPPVSRPPPFELTENPLSPPSLQTLFLRYVVDVLLIHPAMVVVLS
jgi:hypothetical protein